MYQKWLEAFHQVATQGSFTGAARKLNVGQPTISSHVSNLEGRFGVELFHRKGRSITLTPAGRMLFDITHDLYGHEQEAIAFLTSVKELARGELNFSAVGPYDVMEVIASMQDRLPGIKCSVRLTLIEEVVEDLEAFRADIGVTGRDCASDTIHSVFYNQHRVFVIVNREHPLSKRRSVRMKELDGHAMIVRTASSTTQEAFDKAAAKAGIEIEPVFEIESREGLREAIVRNLGIGVISETEFAPHPALHPLMVTDAQMNTRAYIACLKARRNRPLIREVLKLAETLVAKRKKAP
ncbi:MAG: LysR substrate-binding domain-containing protein [Hyphomicrobiaceae bacterium]|nr:LysR substrate-binding domain-containing protein [Hyphomicrobiaceae bacterium]